MQLRALLVFALLLLAPATESIAEAKSEVEPVKAPPDFDTDDHQEVLIMVLDVTGADLSDVSM